MSKHTKLSELSLTEAKKGLENKEFSSKELIEDFIKVSKENKHLNAWVLLQEDEALKQSEISDKNYAQNQARLLEGLPIAVKDLFCVENVRTTACSHILDNYISPFTATVVEKLFNQGAISLGKTNMDEFAMGSSNLTSYYGAVINPWKDKTAPHKNLVPGGSSGGSASAVAADLALAALGSDTGGSIRQPAAFCGIVGLKPTYGRCSRYGMVAFASSLDHPGPITKTVEDAGLMLQVMAGLDDHDSNTADIKVDDYLGGIRDSIKGLRIGCIKEYEESEGLDPEIKAHQDQTIKYLEEAGAIIKHISMPHSKYALPCYYIIAPAEASANLARYDGVRYGLRVDGKDLNEMYYNTRTAGFGEEVKRRILVGAYVLSAGYYDAFYNKAQKVRRLVANDFKKAFEEVDLLLCPTTPTPAFAIGEEPKDPVTMYLNDLFTVTANLAGVPAISVPVGLTSKGLPIGMQLTGKHFDEATLLRVAHKIETAVDFRNNFKK